MFRKILLFALLSVFVFAASSFAAGRFDFAVIQPGQPGNTAEAQPVMDELAGYMSKKLGVPVKGVYYNDLQAALSGLSADKPAWGITDLTFFMSFSSKFNMVPVASTMPQGQSKDVWRLLVPADGPDSVRDIKGTVYGSMLYTPESTAILFGGKEKTSFSIEGTHNALRVLRKVNKGRAVGVCLDGAQYSVVEGSDRYGNTKVVYTSGKLPTSPVVWFDKVDDDALRLQAVLLDMAKDPSAAGLLKLLQTTGFGPADKELK
ncbi:PhnD/SsuA/transferrin family substrate-binding protein [Maridesulfovibrio sp.]|uniref:PhnD/SsuA/transferrin family substrate-binding protein n=1 Tax=Maridesulfovibrio sp. TaxID=2795000 RepID=UPI002A18B36E|nr:PhnD/SsuA/transferrin family substrate-binding protein [Maridesulfovibrio sp.]